MCAVLMFEDVDVNFANASSNEFNSGERSTSSHSLRDATLSSDPPSIIMDFAPEWSYCEVSTVSRSILALAPSHALS